jgi:hypothetical protein
MAALWDSGRGLLRVVAIGADQPLRGRDELAQVGDVRDARPRIDPLDEQRLGLVEVADAGQVALIEQRLADRDVRLRVEPAQHLVDVPVGAEQVRAEVTDELVLVRRHDDPQIMHAIARREPGGIADPRADHVLGVTVRTPAGRHQVPRAVHPQVAVQS